MSICQGLYINSCIDRLTADSSTDKLGMLGKLPTQYIYLCQLSWGNLRVRVNFRLGVWCPYALVRF